MPDQAPNIDIKRGQGSRLVYDKVKRAVVSASCEVCEGRGEVGGFVNAESGYQTDPCPRCTR